MKTSSDDLHRLIKTLSKSEKGYFKKFARRFASKEDNTYIKIFDAIAEMDIYDEEKLKAKFKKESFIKHFAVTKQYLYGQVLKCLHMYSTEGQGGLKFREMLNDIDVLFDKGLFKQCLKLVKKTKEAALKLDQYPIYFQVIVYQKNLLVAMYPDRRDEIRKEIYDEEMRVSGYDRLYRQYSWLYDKLCIINDRVGFIHTKADQKKYDEIMKDPLLRSEDLAVTYKAKMFYHDIHMVYGLASNDFKKAYAHSNKMIMLMQDHPDRLKASITNYMIALQNQMQLCSRLSRYEEAEDMTELIRFIARNKKYDLQEHMVPLILGRNLLILLDMYLRAYQMEKAADKVADVVKYFKENADKVDKLDVVVMQSSVSWFYFIMGRYDESITYLNMMLNSEEVDGFSDLYCYARILNLMIHYELNNYELIEYLLKPARKYISKKDQLYEAEVIMLDLFRDLLKAIDEKERIALFDEFLFKIRKTGKGQITEETTDHIDLVAWASSKINGHKSILDHINSRRHKAV